MLARRMAVEAAKKGLICMLQLLDQSCPVALSGGLKYSENPLYAATVSNQAACVRWLLWPMSEDEDWKPKAYQRSVPVGNYAFQTAAKKGFTNIVKALLSEEPRVLPNMRNRYGMTALHVAAERGHAETVQVLVDHTGTDVNIKTKLRWQERDTALHLAICRRNLEIVQILLRGTGINVSLEDYEGRTPLLLAASLGLVDIVTALLEHGARDDRALFQAFWNLETSIPVVQVIVRYLGRDSNTTSDETNIQTRAHLGEFLFNTKGYCYKDVYQSKRWQRKRLIPIAVKEKDIDLLQVLLNSDSMTPDDVNEEINGPYNVRGWTYRTPLNYARNRGYTEIAHLLSAHGAIDEFRDPDGALAAWEKEEALKSAAKDNESTQPAEEQSTLCEASRETPELALADEDDGGSDLEEESYSDVDIYDSPQSDGMEESERESKRQRRE